MGNFIIPESILEQVQISPAELRLELSLFLYDRKRLSLEQAQILAGLDPVSFHEALIQHGMRVHDDPKESLLTPYPSASKEKPHFLADVIGIMDDKSGEELERIVTKEFQQIEGEW